MTEATQPQERYVLVTTAHRGVFAGVLQEDTGDVVTLRGAQLCVYWDTETHGFLGLASHGPGPGCRVGRPTPLLTLRGVTSLAAISPEARARWEACPWQA